MADRRAERLTSELPPGVLPFDPVTMTEPVKVEGPDFSHSPAAQKAGVSGTMRVRCIITLEGRADGCVVLETLPYMDVEVLWTLEKQTFKPATKGGEPIAVAYDFVLRIPAPSPPPGSMQASAPPDLPPFGKGMTRPTPVSGPPIRHTPEALENRVEGIMIVRCVITEEGRAEACTVIKSLPHMDKAVVASLEASRYTPATFEGKPVRVWYTFTIRFAMPPPAMPPPTQSN